MVTRVYIADTSELLQQQSLFDLGMKRVSEQRRAKVERTRRPINKALSLGAGILLAQGLLKAGIPSSKHQFYCNEYGKPYLSGGELFFNLSHSGTYVAAVLSEREVGIDIQKYTTYRADIIKRFFCPEEQSVLEHCLPEEQARLFFRYWTLKESYVKMCGAGLAMVLRHYTVVLGEQVRIKYAGQVQLASFAELPTDNYTVSVCEKSEQLALIWEKISFSELLFDA